MTLSFLPSAQFTGNTYWNREFLCFFINPLNASVSLIENRQLICCANQLTGFYMRATLAFTGLSKKCMARVLH